MKRSMQALIAISLTFATVASSRHAGAAAPRNLLAETPITNAATNGFTVEKYALDNGLQIWIHYEPTSTIARTELIVKVGSRNETIAVSGISHLLEHMVFTGTEQWNETQIVNHIERLGGTWNAFTSKEITKYHTTVPAAKVDEAVEWLAQVVFHPTLSADKVDREREIVFQEKGGRYDWAWDYAERLGLDYDLTTKLLKRAFTESSLHLSPIGRDAALDRITSADLRAYHDQYYLPNNSVLVVVGKTPPEQVLKLAQKYLGNLLPGDLPALPEVPEMRSPVSDRPTIVRGADLSEQVRITLLAPTIPQGHDDYWALEVVTEMLGKRIYDELRLNQGLIYSAWASSQTYQNVGYLQITTEVKRRNTSQALDTIAALLTNWHTGDLTATAVADAKDALIGRWSLSMDGTENRTFWISRWVGILAPEEPVPDYTTEIAAVTLEDVQRVSRSYLQPDQFYVGMHKPIITVTGGAKWGLVILGLGALSVLGWSGWRHHQVSQRSLKP